MKKIAIFLALVISSFFATAQCWQSVSSGYDFTIAIRSNGTLWGWGNNYNGQLTGGSNNSYLTPFEIGTDANWQTVSAGHDHVMAVKTDGTLWVWGDNFFGQVGNGATFTTQPVPVRIGSDNHWKSVYAGFDYSLALKTDGTLWSWGSNFVGELGNASINPSIPTRVGTALWKAVAAGSSHAIGVQTDNTLWAWGSNQNGEVGDGTDSNTRYFITKIGTDADWEFVAAGNDHSMAIKTNGSLWAWGANDAGQLGDGTTTKRLSPAHIGSSTWSSVSTGSGFTTAIQTDGTLWSWGDNSVDQLGDGTETNRVTPTAVSASSWTFTSSGNRHVFGFQSDGTLWTWGSNMNGELGNDFPVTNKPQSFETQPPAGPTLQTVCLNSTLANITAVGSLVKWYSAASGGTPLSPSQALVNGTHYYATQTLHGGCESVTRLDVAITINTNPTPIPTGQSSQVVCSGGYTLESLTATGSNIKWYAAATGGVSLPLSTVLTDQTHYYASQTISACESGSRLDVTVAVNSVAAPLAYATQSFCLGADLTSLSPSGPQIHWYASSSGGIALPATTALTDGAIFYATQTVNGLQSCTRTAVKVSYVPYNDQGIPLEQKFCEQAFVDSLNPSYNGFTWYDVAAGGSALKSYDALVDDKLYYVTSFNGVCYSPRKAVRVLVNTVPRPVVNNFDQHFCGGATIADLSVTGSNLKFYLSYPDSPLPLNTPLINSDYYVTQTVAGLESCMPVQFSVTVKIPDTPLGPSPQYFCNAGTVTSLATYTFNSKWYDAPTGGNVIDPALAITDGKHYFAAQVSGLCESPGRLDVTAYINTSTTPAPTGLSQQTVCGSNFYNLNATGTIIQWYDAPTGGNLLDYTTLLTTGAHYYASQIVHSCESPSRLDVTLLVNPIPPPPPPKVKAKWVSVGVGTLHVAAVKSDGTLWTWGDNTYGQLGTGTTAVYQDHDLPRLISKQNDWKMVTSGAYHSVAMKRDGSLWMWGDPFFDGYNGGQRFSYPQLPLQIASGSNWVYITAGGYYTMGIKDNGTLWVWGGLAEGSNNPNTDPVQIGADNNWSSASTDGVHVLAVKQDGTLWAWPHFLAGQFNTYTENQYPIARQVGTDADWAKAGAGHPTSIALKRNGTIWKWWSADYELPGGAASGITQEVPGNDWKDIAGGAYQFSGLKIDNSLWIWSESSAGNPTDDIPVRIGSADDKWRAGNENLAFKFNMKSDSTLWRWDQQPNNPVIVTSPDVLFVSCQTATIASLPMAGPNLLWYGSEAFPMAPLSPDTPLTDLAHYLVTQTVNGCSSPIAETIVVISDAPAPPTGPIQQDLCAPATIANLVANGNQIKWYSDPVGGAPLPPASPVTKILYYASQANATCDLGPRLQVYVLVSDAPTPTGALSQSFCQTATVSNLIASGNQTNWYTAPTGGTPLPYTSQLNATAYFATQVVGACESKVRLKVDVTVQNVPHPVVTASQNFCGNASLENLTAKGNDIQWYSTSTGGSALPLTTLLVNGLTYYASQTVPPCKSTRDSVNVVVTPVPGAPTGSSSQAFVAGDELSNLVVNGNAIKWYESSDSALHKKYPIPDTWTLKNGATYFATQTIASCESNDALAVTAIISVATGLEPKSGLSFYPNPVKDFLTIESPSAMSNLEIINAVGQRVTIAASIQQNIRLDLTSLSSGMYFIRAMSGDEVVMFTIVKL